MESGGDGQCRRRSAGGGLPQVASLQELGLGDVCERSSDLSRAYARVGSSGGYSRGIFLQARGEGPAETSRPDGACRRDFLSLAIAPLADRHCGGGGGGGGDDREDCLRRPPEGWFGLGRAELLIRAVRAHLQTQSVDD